MIVVVGLVLAFVLILIFGNRRTRSCRWRKDRQGGGWRCASCGAKAPDAGASPPRICLDQGRGRG